MRDMNKKEQKTVEYLENALAEYAKHNITEGLEAFYPGHNDIERNDIMLEPIRGLATEGPELLAFAMRAAGYALSTVWNIRNPSQQSVYYLDKFEGLVRKTKTYNDIIYNKKVYGK